MNLIKIYYLSLISNFVYLTIQICIVKEGQFIKEDVFNSFIVILCVLNVVYFLLFSFFQFFCTYISKLWLYTFCKLPNCVTAVKFVRYFLYLFLLSIYIHWYQDCRISAPNTNDIICLVWKFCFNLTFLQA